MNITPNVPKLTSFYDREIRESVYRFLHVYVLCKLSNVYSINTTGNGLNQSLGHQSAPHDSWTRSVVKYPVKFI